MAIKFDGKIYAGASDLYLDGFRAGMNAALMNIEAAVTDLRDQVRGWIADGRVDEDDFCTVDEGLTAIIERGA